MGYITCRAQLSSLTTRSNCWCSNMALLLWMWKHSSFTRACLAILLLRARNTAGKICTDRACANVMATQYECIYKTNLPHTIFNTVCVETSKSLSLIIMVTKPTMFNVLHCFGYKLLVFSTKCTRPHSGGKCVTCHVPELYTDGDSMILIKIKNI